MNKRIWPQIAAGDEDRAAALYLALVLIVTAVNDGWSGKPSAFLHQVLLLPFTVGFAIVLWKLVRCVPAEGSVPTIAWEQMFVRTGCLLCVVFESLSIAGIFYENRHFARFGYELRIHVAEEFAGAVVLAVVLAVRRRTGRYLLAAALVAYAAGLLLAIRSFPLNYLRSDMLPVIVWADRRLLLHLNPYTTMHVGARLYDFPYLPGMLVAFLPAVALHADVRFITLACILAMGVLLYGAAQRQRRMQAAILIAVLFLSPFLQYRHDLYLEPHWLALVCAIVLLQRRHFALGAAAFGGSMALYQLSWVLFPFLILFAFRRGGWREAAKTTVIGLAAMLAVLGPFLRSATQRIASNTVGQWSRLPHALADPINLSYWVTYLIRPDQLKWVQLSVLSVLFGFCVFRRRCQTLTETLRWMSGALALFIMLNVLVDGYFYLTLLVLLLMYTFAVTGIWDQGSPVFRSAEVELKV